VRTAAVRLTFTNALRYNPVGHEVHTFAGALLAYFERMYKEALALACFDEEHWQGEEAEEALCLL
jgi:hypothetical protein